MSEHECLAQKVVFAEDAFIVYLNERYYNGIIRRFSVV
ncbi:MAG: hypothetical protein JETT_2651 [Candidatus Jettenia ecosi]|uniref:Uncharacterized protein n=1 Tax=Candidatus Jettenia ecosi TaxID=2494326 RepID=A0A533QKJ2_9BACT|nr:MAG: hypothetical protein JETT_2651 [Candidatus Jettenia ecosi]